MSRNVDELFGESAATSTKPKTWLLLGFLGSGVLLTLLGLACSSVPGALLVLVSWHLSQRELDRVDSGYLPLDTRPQLEVIRNLVWAGILFVVLSFVAQGVLLWLGVYEVWWGSLVSALGVLLLGTPPA